MEGGWGGGGKGGEEGASESHNLYSSRNLDTKNDASFFPSFSLSK